MGVISLDTPAAAAPCSVAVASDGDAVAEVAVVSAPAPVSAEVVVLEVASDPGSGVVVGSGIAVSSVVRGTFTSSTALADVTSGRGTGRSFTWLSEVGSVGMTTSCTLLSDVGVTGIN